MRRPGSRRTTLTLPVECLETAERIARERHLNLSSVVAEALARGLREEEQARRSEATLLAYRKAFAGFTTDELLVLDGIVAERQAPEKPASRKTRFVGAGQRARK